MVTLCSGSWIYPLLRGCLCLHEPAWSPQVCCETFPPECIRTINLLDYLHKQPVLLIFTFVAKLSNSVIIKALRVIWTRLCHMYDLSPNRTFSAFSVQWNVRSSISMGWSLFLSHLQSWRCMERTTLSTLWDITCIRCWTAAGLTLPNFQASMPVGPLQGRWYNIETPLWLRAPHFYLPSKNIMRAVEEDPDFISCRDRLEKLSSMIGVSPKDIMAYVHDKEKIEQKASSGPFY